MNGRSKWEYFKAIYTRYHKAPQTLKRIILNEFCQVCRYNRKYAIRKLNGPLPEKPAKAPRRKRPSTYSSQLIRVLCAIWESAGYPCSVRLKAIVPRWMPWIQKRFQLSAKLKQDLSRISPRTIDYRLRSKKAQLKNRLYGRTKPGTLLKHHIPIKTDHWDVKTPGFTEIDLVSHSGNSARGDFGHSVNQTDILTTWVETRAVLGKGEAGVSQAMEEMEEAFPFKILGIDSDNGSEFINYHLYRRCQKLKIQFTRGRPYKKDDNAHIEQKNWTHVRKLMGWDRYDSQEAIEAMNDLYRHELRLFMNLFMPSMKLLRKERIGSRLKRVYDKPQTPFERLVASHKGDRRKIADLRRLQDSLDPFELAKSIEKKLEHIWSLARHQLSPTVSERPKAEPQQPESLSRVERETFKNLSQTFTGITFYVRDPKQPGKYKPV
jgi:hypothetical protein